MKQVPGIYPRRRSCKLKRGVREGKSPTGALRDAGEQPSCLPRGSLTPSPFFWRRATFAVFDLVMLKVSYGRSFSRSLSVFFLRLRRVDATTLIHVVVGPEHRLPILGQPRRARESLRKARRVRGTIRRRWFWCPAKLRIPHFPSESAGIAQLQSRLSLSCFVSPFSRRKLFKLPRLFFPLPLRLSFSRSHSIPTGRFRSFRVSSLYTDLPQGLICHRRNEQDFMRTLHSRSSSSNRRDCRVCVFYEFGAVAPTFLNLSANWIPTIGEFQFITP